MKSFASVVKNTTQEKLNFMQKNSDEFFTKQTTNQPKGTTLCAVTMKIVFG